MVVVRSAPGVVAVPDVVVVAAKSNSLSIYLLEITLCSQHFEGPLLTAHCPNTILSDWILTKKRVKLQYSSLSVAATTLLLTLGMC